MKKSANFGILSLWPALIGLMTLGAIGTGCTQYTDGKSGSDDSELGSSQSGLNNADVKLDSIETNGQSATYVYKSIIPDTTDCNYRALHTREQVAALSVKHAQEGESFWNSDLSQGPVIYPSGAIEIPQGYAEAYDEYVSHFSHCPDRKIRELEADAQLGVLNAGNPVLAQLINEYFNEAIPTEQILRDQLGDPGDDVADDPVGVPVGQCNVTCGLRYMRTGLLDLGPNLQLLDGKHSVCLGPTKWTKHESEVKFGDIFLECHTMEGGIDYEYWKKYSPSFAKGDYRQDRNGVLNVQCSFIGSCKGVSVQTLGYETVDVNQASRGQKYLNFDAKATGEQQASADVVLWDNHGGLGKVVVNPKQVYSTGRLCDSDTQTNSEAFCEAFIECSLLGCTPKVKCGGKISTSIVGCISGKRTVIQKLVTKASTEITGPIIYAPVEGNSVTKTLGNRTVTFGAYGNAEVLTEGEHRLLNAGGWLVSSSQVQNIKWTAVLHEVKPWDINGKDVKILESDPSTISVSLPASFGK